MARVSVKPHVNDAVKLLSIYDWLNGKWKSFVFQEKFPREPELMSVNLLEFKHDCGFLQWGIDSILANVVVRVSLTK